MTDNAYDTVHLYRRTIVKEKYHVLFRSETESNPYTSNSDA